MPADLSQIERILVPVDFSEADPEEEGAMSVDGAAVLVAEASRRAVRWAVALARAAGPGCRVRMFHATPDLDLKNIYAGPAGTALPAAALDEVRRRAARAAEAVLGALAEAYAGSVSVECTSRPGRPVDAILAEAAEFQPHLIVLSASGRSRVTRFFLGSTADRIIRRAECPVLVIPAEVEAEP